VRGIKNAPPVLETKLDSYRIEGEVEVIDWYGHRGTLRMDPYHVGELTDTSILAGVNDGRFGVQSITKAECFIFGRYKADIPNYHSGIDLLLGKRVYGESDLVHAKRGI
jgi:hypothetical protein